MESDEGGGAVSWGSRLQGRRRAVFDEEGNIRTGEFLEGEEQRIGSGQRTSLSPVTKR